MHKKYLNKLLKRVVPGIQKKGLIKPGDRILLGVSGGKDSLLLIEMLGELKRYLNLDFEVIPIHITIQSIGYKINYELITQLCGFYQFPFRVVEIAFEFDEATATKGACFLCSWHRRKKLFELARELRCNKLALGHHMDDALQTFLMNMIYHGSISSLPFSLSMFNNELQLIRPLLFLSETEILEYKQLRGFPELIKDCPYGENTKRRQMKELIRQLELIHPQARKNMARAMSNIYVSYLPSGEDSLIHGLNTIHPENKNQSV